MQTNQLKLLAYKCQLRPTTIIIDETSTYTGNHDKHGLKFFGVHFYWNESYFDKLQYTNKLTRLKDMVDILIKKLPNYHSHEWGASDGHLFVYITQTI